MMRRNNDCTSFIMRNIDHLTQEEKQHYIKCDCGEYVDMRDLSDVFSHLHGIDIQEPEWIYSI
ncbi:MAG: hypothetical protein ACJ748_04660, partial [Flavisolibacter sp.]